MSEVIQPSLIDKVLIALEKTLGLGGAMLFDIVRRALAYAKAYAVIVTFAVLRSIAEDLASASN